MYKQLTREQRYAIYLGRHGGSSIKKIADQIGVNPSTIYRELKRNSTVNGAYLWSIADEQASKRKKRHPGNRRLDVAIEYEAKMLLVENQWSPKQISGALALRGKYVSHETIYKRIRSDTTGELAKHTRHRMKYRRHSSTKASPIPNRVSIHDRPSEADGTRIGDWEMDLIIGKDNKGSILTLCDRATNFMMMEKLKHGKDSKELAKVVIRLLYPYRSTIALNTITTDNGGEFADHKSISKHLMDTPIYFADPYASWQKGAIENTNKLIRQYIPKGTDFSTISDRTITQIQHKINMRPREKLKFKSPIEVFFKYIA